MKRRQNKISKHRAEFPETNLRLHFTHYRETVPVTISRKARIKKHAEWNHRLLEYNVRCPFNRCEQTARV